jgi:hypothetical protein
MAQFSSLGAFFGGYVAHVYAQQVTDTTVANWCPEWWEHPPAVVGLTLMHRTYEIAIQNGSEAVSRWKIVHADAHMRCLLSPLGTFRYCSQSWGHKSLIPPLPCNWASAPAWVMTASAAIHTPVDHATG